MVPDRIEREIVIEASIETVWTVVTEDEHVGGWFGDAATIDLRPGGEIAFTWNEHGTIYAQVEKVEPPHAFSYRWAGPPGEKPREGNSTLVEFTLESEGEGTRLRVVESGFTTLDRPDAERMKSYEENTGGWAIELDELRTYIGEIHSPTR